MKIASYNIMSGGFAEYSDSLPAPERLDNIRNVVKELDADIIGLIDTYRWDKTFPTQELQTMFAYEHILRTNLHDARLDAAGGKSIGLVLMSRYPWKRTAVVRLATRNALCATFAINGQDVTVFLVYLDDLKEDVRLEQTGSLLEQAEGMRNVVIMGDLNTFAPKDLDSVATNLEHFYENNPRIDKQVIGPVVAEMQKAEVIPLLEVHGFTDAGLGQGPTFPTMLFPAVTRPFLRVDYCFASPALAVQDFQVHTSAETQIASDHYPISFGIV